MNKCRAPKIPPILKEGTFILNCIDKAKLFNEYFSNQCKLIVNNSSLPVFDYITDKRIDSIPIKDNELLLLIRKQNPNKAIGPDGISSQMLLIWQLCCPSTETYFSKYPGDFYISQYVEIGKCYPIFKKNDKQLGKNYRPISLLPICSKLFEKMIFTSLYSYLNNNSLITQMIFTSLYSYLNNNSLITQMIFTSLYSYLNNNSLITQTNLDFDPVIPPQINSYF